MFCEFCDKQGEEWSSHKVNLFSLTFNTLRAIFLQFVHNPLLYLVWHLEKGLQLDSHIRYVLGRDTAEKVVEWAIGAIELS